MKIFSGEPSSPRYGREECASLRNDMHWNDRPCSTLMHYLCSALFVMSKNWHNFNYINSMKDEGKHQKFDERKYLETTEDSIFWKVV